ncbi:pulmonary surfactant-associated protein D-like isoform X2 [Adelges cooleyi]|uniref:pulmonary surfactant-associated protein D-like isoform X2 n=1 Tax=Adelges cooleyi TaxID=133065 RepID=UPI0021806F83|nr:pulmonary surfactant-associated protein D-like isoform X2 [Adelges cooleyi]
MNVIVLEENVTTGSKCMVYECPEYHGFLNSKQNPSLYNYYSMYSKPLPNENYTCVPGIGIFDVVSDRMNFSNAMEACEEVGGHLANIVSETRTSMLSALVSSTLTNFTIRNRRAYVGLFFDEDFVTIMGELLACLPYRAWAPGHPKARKIEKDCVVITSNRYWETENCSKKLPYVCELIADGPMTAVERYCAAIRNPKRRKNCIIRNQKHFEQIKQKEQQCNVNANNNSNDL